ncbi:MAG: alpha/beta fold hydrolase [Chloroflexi bacterium]|nr:MAG: alpha/beta fold hydrolase [Chloroflexota bacterium]
MEFDSDGVRLHYDLHGPESGAPVVLVHGFASDYQLNWVGTRWQETLLGAGYRVIGLDCRGHDDPNVYSMAELAADVRRLLDEVHAAAARYVGYSMGARIGLQAVVDFPDRVRAAVLGGIGAGGAVDDAEPIVRALRGGEPETASALSFQKFASARAINDLEALAACMEGMAPSAVLDPTSLSAIRTPVLLVAGERDEVAHDTSRLAELIPSAELVVIPGRDHLGTVPARQFKEAAVEFLGRH